MLLSESQKRFLRGLGHTRKPVVIIGGAGLTANVVAELDSALDHHELLKVRVNAADRDERQTLIERMCQQTGSTLVQHIGHVALLYRPGEKPRIQLPD